MLFSRRSLNTIFILVIVFSPQILSADVLGNGGQIVKGELKKLTTKASVATLQAAADTFTMISHIEDLERDSKQAVSKFGKKIKEKLKDANNLLNVAEKLNKSEFKKLDEWLTNVDFNDYSKRFNINPDDSVWKQVVLSSKKGGREWLRQNQEMNINLLTQTKHFMEIYQKNPLPENVWELIWYWHHEINRGIFLSIVFSNKN